MKKIEKIIKLPRRYCSYCGEEMSPNMRDADKNMMFYGDQSTIPYGSRHNRKTGERQFCTYFKCPNYKHKKWYQIAGSPHDEYFLDELWVEKGIGDWRKANP